VGKLDGAIMQGRFSRVFVSHKLTSRPKIAAKMIAQKQESNARVFELLVLNHANNHKHTFT
jgi:hypothetical protein